MIADDAAAAAEAASRGPRAHRVSLSLGIAVISTEIIPTVIILAHRFFLVQYDKTGIISDMSPHAKKINIKIQY